MEEGQVHLSIDPHGPANNRQQACTWVGAFVYSHEKDENLFVGALRFKGEKLVLESKIANFVEVYGRRRPVEDIPKVTITFGPPVVNGTAARNPKAGSRLPQRRPRLRRHGSEGWIIGHYGGPTCCGSREEEGHAHRDEQVAQCWNCSTIPTFESLTTSESQPAQKASGSKDGNHDCEKHDET